MDRSRAGGLRLLLVDDNKLLREGLANVFRAQPLFDSVVHTGSLKDALALAVQSRPDAALIATRLPDAVGSSAVKAMVTLQPTCQVIMLASYNDDQELFAAIRAGARGYLLKHLPAPDLVAALKAVLDSETVLFGARPQAAAGDAAAGARRDGVLDLLDRREIEVLREMALGASNAEIARRLYVPEQTVRGHVGHILEKLGLPDRHEAARLARRSGLRVA